MVAQASIRFLSQPRPEALQQNYALESFRLFPAFLPGIGRFFGPVALAYAVQFAVPILLFLWKPQLWISNVAILEKMAATNLLHRFQFLQTLSEAQFASFLEFSLLLTLGFAAYVFISLLIMLWPVYVVFYGKGGLEACAQSALRFLRDPLRLFAIFALIQCVRLPLILLLGLAGANNLFLAVGAQMMSLIIDVFMTVTLFVYGYHLIGKPSLSEPSDSPEKPLETPPTP